MLKKTDISLLCCGFILAGVIFFTISCGSQRTFQTKSSPGGLSSYVIIEIPDFKTSLNSVPTDAVWKIPNEVAERLKKEELFTGVSRSPVGISDRVLVLDGAIVDFTPTVWYKQIIRSAKVTVHVRFINKSDNSVIAEATFEGISKGGIWSGGMSFAYSRLADEILDYIKLKYSS
jgi:hypothetical protein